MWWSPIVTACPELGFRVSALPLRMMWMISFTSFDSSLVSFGSSLRVAICPSGFEGDCRSCNCEKPSSVCCFSVHKGICRNGKLGTGDGQLREEGFNKGLVLLQGWW
uniref:Secreted protein n=1 Tax=Nelumbo nucifera TaxID=4432 RepID=A0A822YC76_NELNU|nr:TPA_asm: hypothetical protein HUJ06_030589 [Nelumbo nucifera]